MVRAVGGKKRDGVGVGGGVGAVLSIFYVLIKSVLYFKVSVKSVCKFDR